MRYVVPRRIQGPVPTPGTSLASCRISISTTGCWTWWTTRTSRCSNGSSSWSCSALAEQDQELDPFEQRDVRVVHQVQQPVVEIEIRQLASEVPGVGTGPCIRLGTTYRIHTHRTNDSLRPPVASGAAVTRSGMEVPRGKRRAAAARPSAPACVDPPEVGHNGESRPAEERRTP